MVQNVKFSSKKTHIWLIPILVLAGLFSWADVQAVGESNAQPVKTELVVQSSKNKAAKKLWYAISKRFTPTLTTATQEYTVKAIQIRLVDQAVIYSRIKSKLSFATCFWMPQSPTSTISC
jgi:hypothetical protein